MACTITTMRSENYYTAVLDKSAGEHFEYRSQGAEARELLGVEPMTWHGSALERFNVRSGTVVIKGDFENLFWGLAPDGTKLVRTAKDAADREKAREYLHEAYQLDKTIRELSEEAREILVGARDATPDRIREIEKQIEAARKAQTSAEKKASHRAGIDLTLSTPKSVSVLFARTDDDEQRKMIGREMVGSVRDTLDHIAREFYLARRSEIDEITGVAVKEPEFVKSFVAALALHIDARPTIGPDGTLQAPDPHLHVHACVFNVVERLGDADGKFSTMFTNHLKANQFAIEAYHSARLAQRLRENGIGIVRDRDGEAKGLASFAVVGVDPMISAKCSRRTVEVDEGKTRQGKGSWTAAEMLTIQRDRIRDELGWKQFDKADHGLEAAANVDLGKPMADEAIIDRLMDRESCFSLAEIRREILKDATLHPPADGVTLDEHLRARMTRILSHRDLAGVKVSTDKGVIEASALNHAGGRYEEPVFSSRKAMAGELRMVELARAMANGSEPVIPGIGEADDAAMTAGAAHDLAEAAHLRQADNLPDSDANAWLAADIERLAVGVGLSRLDVELLAGETGLSRAEIGNVLERLAQRKEWTGFADRPDETASRMTRLGAARCILAAEARKTRESERKRATERSKAKGMSETRRAKMLATNAKAAPFRLNNEQLGMIARLTTDGAGMHVVNAWAGTGKTTAAGIAANVYLAGGMEMLCLAPSWTAAKGLRADVMASLSDTFRDNHGAVSKDVEGKVRAHVPDSLFAILDKKDERAIEKVINRNTVVYLDEASMVGAENARRLLEEARKRGCRVVCQGDLAQLQSVQRGNTMTRLVREFGDRVINLSEIRRQDESWAREATRMAEEGDIRGALEMYRDADNRIEFARMMAEREGKEWNPSARELEHLRRQCVFEYGSTSERLDHVAQHFVLAAVREQRKLGGSKDGVPENLTKGDFNLHECAAYASTNADVNRLNDRIRAELVKAGAVDRGIEIWTTKDGDRRALMIGAGDRIMLTARLEKEVSKAARRLENAKRAGVSVVDGAMRDVPETEKVADNSETATVLGVSNKGARQVMEVKFDDGRVETIDARRFTLTHAYASTVHKAQGASVRNTFVYLGGRTSRELLLVALSRHQSNMEIIAAAGPGSGESSGMERLAELAGEQQAAWSDGSTVEGTLVMAEATQERMQALDHEVIDDRPFNPEAEIRRLLGLEESAVSGGKPAWEFPVWDADAAPTASIDNSKRLAEIARDLPLLVERERSLAQKREAVDDGDAPIRELSRKIALARQRSLEQPHMAKLRDAIGFSPYSADAARREGIIRPFHTLMTTGRGETALHLAAESSGSAASVKALLSAGFDPEKLDADGMTPLDRALSMKAHDNALALIRANPDALFKAASGDKVSRLERMLMNGSKGLVAAMLDAGVIPPDKLKIKGADGKSVIDCAFESKCLGWRFKEYAEGAGMRGMHATEAAIESAKASKTAYGREKIAVGSNPDDVAEKIMADGVTVAGALLVAAGAKTNGIGRGRYHDSKRPPHSASGAEPTNVPQPATPQAVQQAVGTSAIREERKAKLRGERLRPLKRGGKPEGAAATRAAERLRSLDPLGFALREALISGDHAKATTLSKAGANVSLAVQAALDKKPGVALRTALRAGLSIENSRDELGRTPAHNALIDGRADILAALIDVGMTKSIDRDGRHPVRMLAIAERVDDYLAKEIVRMIDQVDCGVDPKDAIKVAEECRRLGTPIPDDLLDHIEAAANERIEAEKRSRHEAFDEAAAKAAGERAEAEGLEMDGGAASSWRLTPKPTPGRTSAQRKEDEKDKGKK